jgi:hypothetical protein
VPFEIIKYTYLVLRGKIRWILKRSKLF